MIINIVININQKLDNNLYFIEFSPFSFFFVFVVESFIYKINNGAKPPLYNNPYPIKWKNKNIIDIKNNVKIKPIILIEIFFDLNNNNVIELKTMNMKDALNVHISPSKFAKFVTKFAEWRNCVKNK